MGKVKGYRPVNVVMVLVGAAGLLALAWAGHRLAFKGMEVSLILGLAVGLAEALRARLPTAGVVSAGNALVLFGLWAYGLVPAMGAVLLGFAGGAFFFRQRLPQALFQTGQGILAAGAAYAGLRLAPGFGGLVASWAAFHLVQSVLLAWITAFDRREGFGETWANLLRESYQHYALDGLAAGALLVAYPFTRWWQVTAVAGLLLLYNYGARSLAQSAQQQALNRLLLWPSLSDAYSRAHAERVMQFTVMALRELNLRPEEGDTIRYAALLHDIGISVDLNRRLNEVAQLSPADRRLVLDHPLAGARIIGRVHILHPMARIVRHHHERWDGLGYPDGLRGEAIPLGSRILAVANAFDSMTASRPYRPARSIADAAAELRREANRQFEGRVVEAFLRALDRTDPSHREADLDQTLLQLREWLQEPPVAAARESSVLLGRFTNLTVSGWSQAGALSAVARLGQTLNSSLTPERVNQKVAETAGRLFLSPCCLALLHGGGSRLTVQGCFGFDARAVGPHLPSDFLGLRAVMEGSPISSYDLLQEYPKMPAATREFFARERVRSALAVPLISRSKPLGALVIYSRVQRHWTPDEIGLLMVVASQGAMGIDNARLFEELQERYRAVSQIKTFNRIIIDDMQSGVLVIDHQGRLKVVNRAARELFERVGLRLPEDLGDLRYRDLVAGSLADSPLLKAMHTGQRQEGYDLEFKGPRGVRYVNIQASPLVERSGALLGAVAVIHDRTQRRQLEEQVRQVEKLAAVGELAAGAAHEIRNPLTSVRGFIQLVQRRPSIEERDRGMLDVVLGEIDRIDAIIQDLLLLARPSETKFEPGNLHHLLEEVLLLARSREQAAKVRFEVALAAADPTVRADLRQLKQVFLNLVQNAIEAVTDVDGAWIQVATAADEGVLVVRITDNGPGIPEGNLPRIFDPFFTTKETGTGLGLAVSFRIVQAHGGRIEVQSKPGGGTSFSVTLPRSGPPPEPGSS